MPQSIVMPSMGMYTEEGVLTAWLRPAGAHVEMGEPILEITTEKVTFEVPSPSGGILHHVAQVGTSLRVQELLGYVLAEGESHPPETEQPMAPVQEGGGKSRQSPAEIATPPAGGSPRASPAARRLAKEHGINLGLVKGSGPGGRIVEADVLASIPHEST